MPEGSMVERVRHLLAERLMGGIRVAQIRWRLAAVLTVLALDIISKAGARSWLEGSVSLIPWLLDLVLVYNSGIAFGWLAGGSAFISAAIILIGAMIIVIVFWQILNPELSRWESMGWSLFLAGAIGNSLERILLGEVTDFLSFKLYYYPLFVCNLADVALTLAVIMLLIHELFPSWLPSSWRSTAPSIEVQEAE
ncbi:MAG: signal peptidase II [Gammaproteobacteria bacterium]